MMAPPTIIWFNMSVRQESESVTVDTQPSPETVLITVFYLRWIRSGLK